MSLELVLTTLLMLAFAGVGVISGFVIYDRSDRKRVLGEIDRGKDDLTKLLASVAESHNTLTSVQAEVDKRVTELQQRISQLTVGQPKVPARFPGM